MVKLYFRNKRGVYFSKKSVSTFGRRVDFLGVEDDRADADRGHDVDQLHREHLRQGGAAGESLNLVNPPKN